MVENRKVEGHDGEVEEEVIGEMGEEVGQV